MYACLYASGASADDLLRLALDFSPCVEQTVTAAVVFSITPLRKLIGSPYQIASEISRAGYERGIEANLAIAVNPDTAILLARHFPGVTLAPAGTEKSKLGALPITALFPHAVQVDPKLLGVIQRWGLKTCEDLAALPECGIRERLGPPGVYLYKLACGAISRPLEVPAPPIEYEQHMDLEYPIGVLEPLLFLFGSVLGELCRALRAQSQAARLLEARLELEDKLDYRCALEFPVPLDDSHNLLKLLQLHLERHPPAAAIRAFTLRLEPAEPKRIQGGMFLPPTPPADKLQLTLARIAGIVGEENAGTPVLLNTHRPDAFEITPFNPDILMQAASVSETREACQVIRLTIRLFRPALHARVNVSGAVPKNVSASGVHGQVIRFAGPWKTSGEWWAATRWSREEWDIALDDGALYRIYLDVPTHEWYVHGVYD